jgi:hypothetical protein
MRKKKNDRQLKSLVLVKWRDAHSDFSGGWINEKDIDPNELEVITVGISLTGVKPNHVSVGQSYASGMVDHVIHIPDAMVEEITVLGTMEVEDDES